MLQDWRSKESVEPFSTERPHVGCWAIICILPFCLPAAKWRYWRTWSVLLGSKNLNVAIHLFAHGHFSPDTENRGCKNSRSRWNILLQKCLSGNAGCELSHVYRMLSGPHTKALIIIRVHSWKGLMNGFVQWKEYNHSLINLRSRSRAGYTFQCFVLLLPSWWFFKAIKNLQCGLLWNLFSANTLLKLPNILDVPYGT